MNRRKTNPGRPPGRKAFRDLAEQHGYTPGEFSMIRMAEQSKLLLRWQTDVARGRVPDELAHLEEDEAMSVARRELADMIENELKFLPYFYPKMQQVESDTRVSGELSLLDLLKATNTDGSTKGSD